MPEKKPRRGGVFLRLQRAGYFNSVSFMNITVA
jgi:hypothetical protein